MTEGPGVNVAGNSARTRSRTGCLCCRRRRKKCDGAQPQCRNCRARGDECRWGLKVMFHPSRTLQLSSEDSAALRAIEERRPRPARRSSAIIIDNTGQVVDEYSHIEQAFRSFDSADASDGEVNSPAAVYQPADNVHSTALATEENGTETAALLLKSIDPALFHGNVNQIATEPFPGGPPHSLVEAGAPSLISTTSLARPHLSDEDNISTASTFNLPFSLGQAASLHASPLPEVELPVSAAEQIQLISAYLQETGTWCETTDSDMHFTVSSVHEMMQNKAFSAAAMALASRQLDAVQRRQRQRTLGLYQHAIQLLIHQDPSQADAAILATCTLLCVYEMMASEVGEWRRHLKGCAGLLMSKKWNGSSQGIVNACFWAFARIDVWAAFITGEKTLIPTDYWVDDSAVRSVAATGAIDAYCNLATLIFAKITNLMAESRRRPVVSNDQALKINSLWHELQDWRDHRLKEAFPLLRADACRSNLFRTILFTHSASICGNTFYHAGSILLLQTGKVWQERADTETSKFDPSWHAEELVGISTTNASHANWVNQLQPLYLAGTVFGNAPARRQSVTSLLGDGDGDTLSEQDRPAEKFALLKHLAKMERETGWKTSERAGELRRLWGIE